MESGTTTPLSGQCLCGAVSLRVTPEAMHADACHCAMCRRWSGGPFMSLPCGTNVVIEQDGDALALYDSSDWGQRGFCKRCGSLLFYRMREQGTYYVSTGLFDDIEGLSFETEIFIDSKPGWYAFANDTRKMTGAEVVAAFAAD